LFVAQIPFDVSYGIVPWLAAELRFPLRVVDIRPTFRALDGTPLPFESDIHHQKKTLAGAADPWLAVRFAGRWRGLRADARVGATLPLGKTQADPFELGHRGIVHEHIQFGSGTLVPIVGGALSYAWPRIALGAAATGLFSFYDNSQGYRAPTRYAGSLRVTVPLLAGALRPFAVGELSHENDELWHGKVGGEGPSARSDLLVGGGVSWSFLPPWTADLGFRARIAKLNGSTTLDYPAVVELGVATSFDLHKRGSSSN
jgi:hypothetical protein